MQPWHAKKLKVGDEVIWMSKESHAEHGMHGTVTKKYYNTVRVLWADGATTTNNVMKIEEEKRAVEAVKAHNAELLKRPIK